MIHPSAIQSASAVPVPTRSDVRLDTSLEMLLAKAPRDEKPKVLATIVATAGSTYRKPGARMLIMSDGSYLGLLSGGCLEADLKLHAQQVMDTDVPRAVEYDMRGADDVLFGMSTGCEGAMRVMLEPAGPQSRALAALAAAGRATAGGTASALVIVHSSMDNSELGTHTIGPPLNAALIDAAREATGRAASRELSFRVDGRARQAFLQYLAPPPHLLICGAGPDAQPVAFAALALGWRVTLVDHRPHYAIQHCFPGAKVVLADAGSLRTVVNINGFHAAVVMSHHLPSDTSYLRELAEAGAPGYVGLLGPVARWQRLAVDLGGAAERLKGRIRGPVGLDLGAVTPEGIALSIISQIHAWLAQRDIASNHGLRPANKPTP